MGLRDVRKAKGLSQEDLGNMLNMTRASISNIESGKVNPLPLTVNRIAKVLNTDIENIIDFKNLESSIKRERYKRGMTQKEFAKFLKISSRTVYEMEKFGFTFIEKDTQIKIANKLNVGIDYLTETDY